MCCGLAGSVWRIHAASSICIKNKGAGKCQFWIGCFWQVLFVRYVLRLRQSKKENVAGVTAIAANVKNIAAENKHVYVNI